MSRIKEAFKDGKALIGFLTAGVPSAEDTLDIWKIWKQPEPI